MSSKFYLLFLFVFLGSQSFAQFKLYEKGHSSYTSGNYADAIQNFSEYLTKPTRDKALDVEVFYLRALSYYKTNDFKNAINDFQETILLDHKNVGNIYWFLAKSYDKTGSLPDALGAYTSALRELDSNADSKVKLFYERSQIHTRMGNLTLAYADLKAAATLQPGNADVKRELAKLEKQNVGSPITTATGTQVAKNNQPTTQSTQQTKKEDKPPAKSEEKVVSTPTPAQQTVLPVVIAEPTLADLYKDEKRYALIIGNSAYPKAIGLLKNPVNDATDFAKELENSNFEVQLLTNATYGQMRAAML